MTDRLARRHKPRSQLQETKFQGLPGTVHVVRKRETVTGGDHNGMVDLTHDNSTFFCRVLYDHQSNDPSSELSFYKGDIIEVLALTDSGWWDGLLNDKRGWFPSSFITRISEEEARVEARNAVEPIHKEPWRVFEEDEEEEVFTIQDPIRPPGLETAIPTPPTVPFSKTSELCLDGKISEQSQYAVACGGYADVWTGSLGSTAVAIKVMRPFSSVGTLIGTTKLIRRLWREYLAWSSLSHPNILKCLGFSYDFTPQSYHQVPSLISPWMPNGTVLSYSTAHPDADRLSIIVGIAQGLAYLHNRTPTIIHGDLRAGNVLVSETGIPCLTDFGLSKIISQTQGMTTSSEVAGSLRWMAPELFHGDNLSTESDIWAYGMAILEIFTGKRPFYTITLDALVLHQIMGGHLPPRPTSDIAPSLTDEVWSICQDCWHILPTRRPRINDILAGTGLNF